MLRWEDGEWKWLCAPEVEGTWAARKCWRAVRDVGTSMRVPVFVDTGAFSELRADEVIPGDRWLEMLDAQLALGRKQSPP